MYRGWLLSALGIGVALGALFAAYPLWDVQVADWFYDHQAHEFPLATNYEWNMVRRFANWITYIHGSARACIGAFARSLPKRCGRSQAPPHYCARASALALRH
jgi:hypothetical protein